MSLRFLCETIKHRFGERTAASYLRGYIPVITVRVRITFNACPVSRLQRLLLGSVSRD